MKIKSVVTAAVGWVRRNPDEVVRAAVNAAGLRFGIPLAALRYLAENAGGGKKMPKDIELGATPPALGFSATVDAMGTPLRASASIKIDEIEISTESVRVAVRLNDVRLAVIGESESPVATLIKSGALDLSKPGNLVKFIPKRPPAVVEAGGDRVVIDLLKVPQLASNERFRKALAVLTPLVGVRAIETDDDHVYVSLKATPLGLLQAFDAIRSR